MFCENCGTVKNDYLNQGLIHKTFKKFTKKFRGLGPGFIYGFTIYGMKRCMENCETMEEGILKIGTNFGRNLWMASSFNFNLTFSSNSRNLDDNSAMSEGYICKKNISEYYKKS